MTPENLLLDPLTVLCLDTPGLVEMRHPVYGTSYFYKTDQGKWETARDKMIRLKHTVRCQYCKKEFITYDDATDRLRTCDSCQERIRSEKSKECHIKRRQRFEEERKTNPDLTWTIFNITEGI